MERGEKGGDGIDMAEFEEAGHEKLVAPDEAHVEEEQALEAAADFNNKTIDPVGPKEGGVSKHRRSTYCFFSHSLD